MIMTKVAIERVIPGETDQNLYLEHLGRYEFARRFVRGMRVLDVACGVGYGAPLLCGAGAERYVGIDASGEALGIAKNRYQASDNISFVFGDACELVGINGEDFDVVVSFETIEHLRDPERFLDRVRDVLVPNGKFIVSTPNRAVSDPANTTRKPSNPFHLREWTIEQFVVFLQRSFEVEQVLGQVPCPRWKVMARRLASEYRLVRGAAKAYRVARDIRRPNVNPAPVERIGLGRYPTFTVCVCRPLST